MADCRIGTVVSVSSIYILVMLNCLPSTSLSHIFVRRSTLAFFYKERVALAKERNFVKEPSEIRRDVVT